MRNDVIADKRWADLRVRGGGDIVLVNSCSLLWL